MQVIDYQVLSQKKEQVKVPPTEKFKFTKLDFAEAISREIIDSIIGN